MNTKISRPSLSTSQTLQSMKKNQEHQKIAPNQLTLADLNTLLDGFEFCHETFGAERTGRAKIKGLDQFV